MELARAVFRVIAVVARDAEDPAGPALTPASRGELERNMAMADSLSGGVGWAESLDAVKAYTVAATSLTEAAEIVLAREEVREVRRVEWVCHLDGIS